MTFDTKKLIKEVESRKEIWDVSSEEYSDRDLKKRRWEEITNIMCEEKLTEKENNEFSKILQQKWKNIRTSFSRELRRRAGAKNGSTASRKNPYVFFEQLQFLRETIVNSATQASIDESNYEDGGNVQIRSPVAKNKKKTWEDSEKKKESDSDRLFMLSLLEDFRKIPEHRKLSTKIELMNVINNEQMLTQDIYNQDVTENLAAGPCSHRFSLTRKQRTLKD